MDSDTLWKIFIAIAPTLGVLFIFYHVMKGVIEGDRRERIAHAQWEREQDRRDAGSAAATASGATEPGTGRPETR